MKTLSAGFGGNSLGASVVAILLVGGSLLVGAPAQGIRGSLVS